METERVYEVEFIKYNNYCRTVISDDKGELIHITNNFLIRESEIPKYSKYGIKNLRYIGNISLSKGE